MDGKRDYRCGIATGLLYILRYGFSPCIAVHAGTLIWMADRRNIRCDYLYFYADCAITSRLSQVFSDYHVEQQCCPARFHLSAA